MSIGWYIYMVGVAIALLDGIISLIVTDDEECNMSHFACYVIAIFLSTLSWVILSYTVFDKVRDYIKDSNEQTNHKP